MVFILGVLRFSDVKAEDPYKYYTWTVTYGTASPLGVPQQVLTFIYILCFNTHTYIYI